MFTSVITAIITGSAPHPLWSPRWQKWSSPACATPSPNSPSLDVLWWLLPRALWFSSWDCRVSLRFCRSTVTSTAWVWHHWPANLICGVCVWQAGIYWISLTNTFASNWVLLIICLVEVIGFIYVYGMAKMENCPSTTSIHHLPAAELVSCATLPNIDNKKKYLGGYWHFW